MILTYDFDPVFLIAVMKRLKSSIFKLEILNREEQKLNLHQTELDSEEINQDNVSTSVFGNDSYFFAITWILKSQFDLEEVNRFLDELINLTCDENGKYDDLKQVSTERDYRFGSTQILNRMDTST